MQIGPLRLREPFRFWKYCRRYRVNLSTGCNSRYMYDEKCAVERIVRHLLSVFGEKRAGLVLLLSGFLLSISVFFDTVFFLLIPLARAMAIRSGGKYLFL